MAAADERAAFAKAVADYAAAGERTAAVAAMLELATEGRTNIKRWAAQWLDRQCNVIIAAEEQEDTSAASPASVDLLQ